MRGLLSFCLAAVSFPFVPAVSAQIYPIILKGKVTMQDGSPPPATVGIERVCSDLAGTAPGPITNKKGEYLWRMDYNPLATRSCYLRATHSGYDSSKIDISDLDTTRTETTLPPLVLYKHIPDPNVIHINDSDVPLHAKSSLNKAMKALDKPDYKEAAQEFQAAVTASPKFAEGWHSLGVVDLQLNKPAEARDAFQHAIEADPKLLTASVMLVRADIKIKDWQAARTAADSLIKADTKRTYPEIYLHRAVARYQLKDLDGALEDAKEALSLDPSHQRPRAEYVLGRILEAKGDLAGAREHMSQYLKLDSAPADVELVKGHLDNLGKPENAGVEPELE